MEAINDYEPAPQPLAERPDGDTPETAVPAENVPRRPVARYFNFIVHEAVQKLLSAGVWVDLGPKFGNLRLRLRPFSSAPVLAQHEAAVRKIRIAEGITDEGPIPAAKSIDANRAAVLMAITEADGRILAAGDPGLTSQDPNILAQIEGIRKALTAARDQGIKVIEEEGLTFIEFEALPRATVSTANPVNAFAKKAREDHAERVRRVLQPLLDSSNALVTQLFITSKALQGVKEEEIYRLGEDYVYGLVEESDWHD